MSALLPFFCCFVLRNKRNRRLKHIKANFRIQSARTPVRGTRLVHVMNESTGEIYDTSILNFEANKLSTHQFLWDGKHLLDKSRHAPTGRYKVSIELPRPGEPWVRIITRENRFKVSDLECVRIADWVAAPIAHQPLDRAFHVLDRHIVQSPGVMVLQRYFGNYDYSLLITPRPAGFTGKREAPSYTLTKGLMTTEPYKTVMRFATAIQAKPGTRDPLDLYARYAPVVFPNRSVVWVRLIENSATNIHTIYPYYEGQMTYEKNIH